MARPLRVDVEGGTYHVISRGTERAPVFRDDGDRDHFLDRLAEAQRRFRLGIHAYVLMDNHFHLIVGTPEANLSRAIQWLKVSYSMWFNAKYRRVGPLFQGRFKGHPANLSVPIPRRIRLSTVPLPATVRYNHSRDSCRVGALVWLPR